MLGLSWGGIVAQNFYGLYPGRVLKLILADTYAGWKGSLPLTARDERLARCERDSELPPGDFASRWVPEMFTSDASQGLRDELASIFVDFHPIGFRLMAQSSAQTDTRHVLPTIAAPTLLLWGNDDRRSPIAVAQRLCAAIPGSELIVIAHAGHVSNMEQPGVFNAHVRRFCAGARLNSSG